VLLPVAVLSVLILLLFGSAMQNSAQTLKTISFFGAAYQIMIANELHGTGYDFDPEGFDAAKFDYLTGEQWMKLLAINDNTPLHVLIILVWVAVPIALTVLSLSRAWRSKS